MEYFQPAPKPKGTDYYLSMTLVAETSPVKGIQCNTFNIEKSRLPHVQRIGDIACLHKIHVSKNRGAPQLVSRKGSSVICFDGHVGVKVTGSINLHKRGMRE